MPVPRLRPLDLVTTEWNGQQVVCARDYEGLLDSPVVIPLPVVLVALLLDGRREIPDVQADYARLTGGTVLPSPDIERIIQDLDAHSLLVSPALDARRREIAAEYRGAPHRAPSHAGLSYPDDPGALSSLLRGYLQLADGSLVEADGVPGTGQTAAPRGSAPRGILAPHIDFRRGGRVYGRAYRALGDVPAGACVVILGVAHAAPPAPYTLTSKAYQTPFGMLEVDRPLLDAVASRCRFDLFAHEPVHRTEHSIEFQAVFLAYLTQGRRLTILPILCGGLEGICGGQNPEAGNPEAVAPARSPEAPGSPAAPQVEAFVSALRRAVAECDRPVYLIGGVDLSHVGPRFGDAEPVGPALAAATRAFDLRALERVAAGDAEGFRRVVMEDGNRRRVCGSGAIYTALRVLGPVRGRVLEYGQGVDPAGGLVGISAVRFDS